MRISDIISLGKQYLFLGIVFAVILTLCILLGYLVGYKKIFKGEKKITKGMLIWFIIFVCYLVVVIGATMLSRGSWYENTKIQPLFYSYIEAWNNFEPREWRNIILNMLLFVPLGFLLPMGIKRFRVFWKIYFVGFLLTLGIETLQLLLKRGVFELDDILNNTIGATIGYGCFALITLIISLIKGKQKYVKRTIIFQLPLFIVIVSFAMIFITYAKQDLGNLSFAYITKVDEENLTVDSDEKYSTSQESLAVYKTKQYSREETYPFAEKFFNSIGDTIDKSRTDLYDETAVYYSVGGYSFWMDYRDGTYSFTDFDTIYAEPIINTESDATEEDIKSALEQYGIELPDGVDFSNDGDGKYTFTANEIITNGTMYDGTFSCQYYENGKMGSISGDILQCEYYKRFDIISEEDAYKMIEEGKFNIYSNSDKLNIKIGQVTIQYMTDTKGYYQPIYVFGADVNGDNTEINIPAIEQMRLLLE